MEVLLNLIDDLAHIPRGIVGVEPSAGSSFDNQLLMSCTDGRVDIRTEQRHDVILVRRSHRAGGLSSLALWNTRFTDRDTLLQDDVIAAKEPGTELTEPQAIHG